MAASPGQTTRARSIETVDGYVSRGRAPPPSVPRDFAMLQDFACYLELRLKSQNLSLLRRIFADYLNEHDNTLGPMMQQGCSIITIFPMLRTSPERLRKAQLLLAKPKFHIETHGCVFLYLQFRTATRNMALLKYLFLEFLNRRETALTDFVQRGCQVISVIPFKLPQMVAPAHPTPPPVQQHESPREVDGNVETQPSAPEEVMQKAKKVKKRRTRRLSVQQIPSKATSTPVVEVQKAETTQKEKRREKRRPRTKNAKVTAVSGDDSAQQQVEAVATELQEDSALEHQEDISAADGPDDDSLLTQEPSSTEVTSKPTVAVSESSLGVNEAADTEAVPSSPSTTVPTPRRGRNHKAKTVCEEPEKAASAASTAEPAQVPLVESEEHPKAKKGQKRKLESSPPAKEKSHKRGKPAMSDEMCRSQLELTDKMGPYEAQIPWEAVYANLPAPFDELKHPELSRKFRKFWRKHARAVWERNFWSPMSRKLSLLPFNKRNNRQLTAKNAFESIIISAFEELGAGFFVMLDSQKPRHPGWWYRGPVVALFALQQIKGEESVWDYVQNEALKRFPDCKLPLPLKAPNSGAVLKCHKRDSESMWMANHRLTPGILRDIAQFKVEQESCEQTEGEGGKEAEMTLEDCLGFL